MKKKIALTIMVFCFILCMMPLTAAAKPAYNELELDDFICEYSSNSEFCPDDNQYDFSIFSRMTSKKVVFVPVHYVQLVFLVYDADGNICANYVSESSFWFNKPKSIDKVIKKDKKLKNVAELYNQVVEAECQYRILEQIDMGKDTTPKEQIEHLGDLKKNMLGDFEGIVSDFQYEFLEVILTSSIDQANSVFQSASKADPVIEFFKMVFLDLFGLGDSGEDFSSHVAKMAGNSVFDALGSITGQLYDGLGAINPEEIYSVYKDRYTVARGDIIAIIMDLNKTVEE